MALKSDLFDLLLQNVVPMGTVTAVEAATETSRATARTVWLTGLPSAGKTTIALGLAARLRDAGRRVEVLDGDAAREVLTAGSAGRRDPRRERAPDRLRRRPAVAQRRRRWCSVISPFRGAQDEVRARHDGRFVEVWVATPLDVCARRDVKGLYARHAAEGDWPDRCRRSVRGSGRSRGRARRARDDRRRVRRAGVGGGVRMRGWRSPRRSWPTWTAASSTPPPARSWLGRWSRSATDSAWPRRWQMPCSSTSPRGRPGYRGRVPRHPVPLRGDTGDRREGAEAVPAAADGAQPGPGADDLWRTDTGVLPRARSSRSTAIWLADERG